MQLINYSSIRCNGNCHGMRPFRI